MYALRQDGRDLNARRTRVGKIAGWLRRRGGPLSTEDKDRFLLTVALFARLDRVSAPELQTFYDHAIAPTSTEADR